MFLLLLLLLLLFCLLYLVRVAVLSECSTVILVFASSAPAPAVLPPLFGSSLGFIRIFVSDSCFYFFCSCSCCSASFIWFESRFYQNIRQWFMFLLLLLLLLLFRLLYLVRVTVLSECSTVIHVSASSAPAPAVPPPLFGSSLGFIRMFDSDSCFCFFCSCCSASFIRFESSQFYQNVRQWFMFLLLLLLLFRLLY